jgi:hypothetical protein
MPKRLFTDVPEDLAALGDESLADLLTSFRETSGKLKRGEIDLADHFGDEFETDADRSAEAMRQWQEAAETVREIRAVQTERAEAAARFEETADEIHSVFEDEPAAVEAADETLASEAKADDDEEDDDDDEAEKSKAEADGVEAAAVETDETPEAAEAVGEAEALTAAAVVEPKPVLFPAVSRRNAAPVEIHQDPASWVVLVAAGGNRNARLVEGEVLDRSAYAEAAQRVVKSYGRPTKTKDGKRERILVASAKFDYPDEQRLIHGDDEGNAEKIAEIGNYFLSSRSREVITAAGGICAPPTPFYDLPGFGTTARPVRDFLPSFQADRGGVLIPGVTTIADVPDEALTIIEAEDDAQGGTFATKSCADMDCAEWTATYIGAIAHCRTYGNFNARTWGEGVAHENDLTMVNLARTAEGRLLDRIDALSLGNTGLVTYGASSSLLYALTLQRLSLISSLRMDPDTTRVQTILPFWAASMFAMDLVNGAVDGQDRFAVAAQAVSPLLARFGIDVGWHLDEGLDPSATPEIWPATSDGAVQGDWPGSTVVARVFLPGTFLHLDGGELDLGLIRDSTLIETNDYELFGEIFENVARVGPAQAARRVTLAICPDGTLAGRDTSPFTCSAS